MGFDKNDWVGGLWHFTEEDKTSVLPCQSDKTMVGNTC